MRQRCMLALFLGVFLAASFDAAAAKKAPVQQSQDQVTPQVGKLLAAVQEAIQKENWEEAMGKLAEAQAVPDKTSFDEHTINEFLGYVYIKRGEFAAAAKAFQFGLDAGFLPPDKAAERVRVLTQVYFQAKDYPKAIEFGTRWREQAGSEQTDVNVLLGQSYYLTDDYRNAATFMQAAIDAATRNGQPINETWLQVLLSSYAQLKDQPGMLATLQRLALNYQKKTYWQDLLGMLRHQPGIDDRTQLNVLRLAFETGLMKNAGDYFLLAELASRVGVPGESIKVLEQGSAAKVFTTDLDIERCSQMLREVRAAAVLDRKALAALEKEARSVKSGEAEVQLGIALISYDQLDKGAEAIQRGLDKGKLKRPDEAEIMLGKALLKLNRTADAQAAFDRVADGAKLAVIADLWRIYSERPAWLTS